MQPIVVFDLDDTLYPESAFVASGFRAVSSEIARLYGVSESTSVLAQVLAEGYRGRIFNETLQRLDIPHSDESVEHLVRIYREHQPDIHLYPDAAPVLEQLRGRMPLAMISDGWEFVQRRKLRALGIEDFFTPAVFTFDKGCDWHKPSRRPFDHVAKVLGGSSKRFVYVADNAAKDFGGAAAAGWRTVHIVRADSVQRPFLPKEKAASHTLFDLHELMDLLKVESEL
jgi:putative hydrolase of the HAD superfamily